MSDIKHDKNGAPFRTLFDRLRSPEDRLKKALKDQDGAMVVAMVKAGVIKANHVINPIPTSRRDFLDRSDYGQTIFHQLVLWQDMRSVVNLLDLGADPNIKTFFNETPVHYAAKKADMPMMSLLAARGGDLQAKISSRSTFVDEDNYTPTALRLFEHAHLKEGASAAIPQFNPEAHVEILAEHEKQEMLDVMPDLSAPQKKPRKM